MKVCYLVLAPEGSGSRLMAEILVRNGVAGSFDHDEPLLESLDGAPDKIMIRLSLPFGGDWPDRRWPDLNREYDRLRRAGCDVRVVVILRNAYCAVQSQLHRGLVKSINEGYQNYSRAVAMIGRFVEENALPARWVTYESISVASLSRLLDGWVDVRETPVIRYENSKYLS